MLDMRALEKWEQFRVPNSDCVRRYVTFVQARSAIYSCNKAFQVKNRTSANPGVGEQIHFIIP